MDYLFYQPQVRPGVNNMLKDEALHCTRALRKKHGDIINVTDGKGFFYTARLVQVSSSGCLFEVIGSTAAPVPRLQITVAVSPLKHPDRFEWLVEKCTEAGVHTIVPVVCDRTFKTRIRTERLHKVAVNAMKQSLRPFLPHIREPVPLTQWLDTAPPGMRFICTANGATPERWTKNLIAAEAVTLLIGPEGDFSDAEKKAAIDHGFEPISLAPNRLRTETAALAATLLVNAFSTTAKPEVPQAE